MVVNILATLINVGLDYVLIFGEAGFPEMGIDGAAIATSLSFVAIAVMYVVHMLWTERRPRYCLWSGRRFDRELFGRLFRFGFPSGVQQFLDIACWSIFVQLIGRLGKPELAGHGTGVQSELAGVHAHDGTGHRRHGAGRPADRRRPAASGRAHHLAGVWRGASPIHWPSPRSTCSCRTSF